MKINLLLILFLGTYVSVKAQWTTNGSNIYFNTGNVGIGTTTPASALEIIKPNTFAKFSMSSTGSVVGTITGIIEPKWNGVAVTGFSISSNYPVIFQNGVARVDVSGGMSINTPDALGYGLKVYGKIGAREIIVTNANPWPDYVFKPQYKLLPLKEVEEYIVINNHLPEIPSADQISKSGQNLSEMNMLLLKKVEELTLYLIEQDKKIALLQDLIVSEKQN